MGNKFIKYKLDMDTKKIDTNKNKNNTKKKMLTLKNIKTMKLLKNSYTKLSENPIPFLDAQSIESIVNLLKDASFQYYKGSPVISDDIFDIMKDYLEKKDPKNPILKEIGAVAPGEKVDLPYWMGSLDKIREDEKVLNNWKTKYPGDVIISDKLDGNSALLVINKKGAKMYSRGDGFKGQDISHLISLIKGIPTSTKEEYAIRGELIISKENWSSHGKGANARNAVAGLMHSKVPDPELVKYVDFVSYECLSPRLKTLDGLEKLKTLECIVVHHMIKKTSELTMESLSTILLNRRSESPYDVDGIVVYHNDNHNQIKGKNPSYAFAFKSLLTHTEAEVIVKEVTWNASKDGFLKPLIHFDPVVLAGASIQKATGFNAQYIEKNNIGPGSRIVIIRSGDVIPHVVRILSKSALEKPSFPSVDYVWNDTHVDILLKDSKDDPDVMIKRITHFTKVLNMKGVGPGIVERLYTNGINTFKKFINVTVEELLKIEGFQKKSAEKIVSEIHESVKNADCLTFMTASNLFGRSIADKKLKIILIAFPEIPNGYLPKETDLSKVSGIGEVTAKQFLEGLPLFFDFMKTLGLECKKVEVEKVVVAKDKLLTELVVVFTGGRDKKLEEEIEARGGKVGTSISSKTTVLVAKDPSEDSGKIKSAKELNIPVVNIETFKKNYM